MQKRVLVFIVAYNSENYIVDVLRRIPPSIWTHSTFDMECLIIDDQSTDQTFQKVFDFVTDFAKTYREHKITLLQNPQNQGYGGNQKLGYQYAIQNEFDVVVLLHGDAQYPPEMIEELVTPILHDEADVVLGSRMLDKMEALKGKMPLYKWVGNQLLTALENWILRAKLSEYHTGFRAYRVTTLASIPFAQNSNYFDFDTDILIQLIDNKKQIKEIPIPTHYGTQISRVNSIKYGLLILKSALVSRLIPYGIFYHPKFDYRPYRALPNGSQEHY